MHEGPFGVGGGAVHASKLVDSAAMRRKYLAPIEEGYSLSDEPGTHALHHARAQASKPVPAVHPCVLACSTRAHSSRRERARFANALAGFYDTALGFGIRIEADLVAEAASTRYAWGARPYLSFRYLSPIPMCRALIATELLADDEVAWVDALHRRCRAEITEELLRAASSKGRGGAAGAEADAKAARQWLLSATEPLCAADAPVRAPARAVVAVAVAALAMFAILRRR